MPTPEKPLFSVVVPTYNRARMTAAAVLSVLGQTEGDFECLVVNDGSRDETRDLLERLPKDPRLIVIHQAENRGQHVCRNLAIRRARGTFVTFLDSDDLYLPRRLEAFRAAARKRPETSFWFSNAYVRRFGRILGTLFNPGRDIPEGRVPGYYAVGDEHLPYVTTNVAIRREEFNRHGFYREDLKILEDTELYSRMLAGGVEVGAIKEPLAVRRLHEAQITGDYERDLEEALLALAAGEPPEEVAAEKRRRLVVEVATYLWKGLKTRQARACLVKGLGEDARGHPLYAMTFLPRPLLRALKSARGLWLRARFHPLFAGRELREAEAAIRPFLKGAERL